MNAPPRRFGLAVLVAWGLIGGPTGLEAQRGRAWPEADRLFRQDPRWLGADAAYSIPLAPDRILWLFGDSWIAAPGRRARSDARLVSNTIAIQLGADPSQATIRFSWGSAGGRPRAFFQPPDGDRLWPAHGVRLGDRLVMFFLRVVPSPDPLGFAIGGWRALVIANPDAEPDRWRVRWLPVPAFRWGLVPGAGGMVVEGDHVYAFSPQEPGAPHPVYLARWTQADLAAGRLDRVEWWQAPAGWRPDRALQGAPTPLFSEAQTEFSVHRDPATGRYLQVQSLGFGAAAIAMRSATGLTGPWSGPDTLYLPPEASRPAILIYAAKAHPELSGADLVLTYATNLPLEQQLRDTTIYYPRFVRWNRPAHE